MADDVEVPLDDLLAAARSVEDALAGHDDARVIGFVLFSAAGQAHVRYLNDRDQFYDLIQQLAEKVAEK